MDTTLLIRGQNVQQKDKKDKCTDYTNIIGLIMHGVDLLIYCTQTSFTKLFAFNCSQKQKKTVISRKDGWPTQALF